MSARVGTINSFTVYGGKPGCGKTTAIVRDTLRDQRRWRCYAVAVDAHGNLPVKLHDGTPTGVVRHMSIDSIRERLKSDARGIHTIQTPDATPLALFAVELAKRAQSPEDRDGNKTGIPVILIVDECALWREARDKQLGETALYLATQRRQAHVVVKLGTQSVRRIHYTLIDQASEVQMFRTTSSKDLARLRDGGIPDDVLAQLSRLPRFKPLTYRDSD